MRKAVIISLNVFVTSCSTVDSDHANQKHSIECVGNVSSCHKEARQLCPDGYLVTNRVRPRKEDGDTFFTLKIKCRSASLFY